MSDVWIRCPECQYPRQVDAATIGQWIPCTNCKKDFVALTRPKEQISAWDRLTLARYAVWFLTAICILVAGYEILSNSPEKALKADALAFIAFAFAWAVDKATRAGERGS